MSGSSARPTRSRLLGKPANRAILVLVAFALVAAPLDAASGQAREAGRCSSGQGGAAFHYAPRLTSEELGWLRRFDVVVLASSLPPDQVADLRRGGTRLFFYEWLTGLYRDGGHARPPKPPWEAAVDAARARWLLNPGRPEAGPDGRGKAYFFDPFPADLRLARARRLSQKLRLSSYDGVFFDLVGSPYVPERLRRVYAMRHPLTSYDEALGAHLRTLRRLTPTATIFTNQGYRTPEAYLPLTDYDLSESLITSYEGGEAVDVAVEGGGLATRRETFYRPWDELRQLMDSLEAQVERYNPAVAVFHLNYVNPLLRPTGRTRLVGGKAYPVCRVETDRPAIYYGYAAAKLWGRESFSASGDVRAAWDEIYFADLGKALGARWEDRDGLVRRYYERGIVVLNPSDTPRTADLGSPLVPADVAGLWNCYERRAEEGLTVTVEPTSSPVSHRRYPAGRIYLYLE